MKSNFHVFYKVFPSSLGIISFFSVSKKFIVFILKTYHVWNGEYRSILLKKYILFFIFWLFKIICGISIYLYIIFLNCMMVFYIFDILNWKIKHFCASKSCILSISCCCGACFLPILSFDIFIWQICFIEINWFIKVINSFLTYNFSLKFFLLSWFKKLSLDLLSSFSYCLNQFDKFCF